ncbi:MAG: hypothetical protein HC769_06790 [Cyanobacteria bacterium CRU_2_1]|nr:hypothetical protein [Cyanobacteria bacterium RU_5_0]NJR58583.1 hypothetical protein [Cyanobacteria bacterium CRU_2_1]
MQLIKQKQLPPVNFLLILPSVGADTLVCPLSQSNPAGIAPTPCHPSTENLQVKQLDRWNNIETIAVNY